MNTGMSDLSEQNYICETERLRLRRVRNEDLPFIYELFSDAEMMKFYPGLRSRAEAQRWIEFVHCSYKKYGHGKWILESKKERTPIGQAGLVITDIDGIEEVELGYFLHKKYWGLGYATEAAAAIAKMAFDRFGYYRIVSAVNPANAPSALVAKRLGMKIEKTTIAKAGGYSWQADIYILPRPEKKFESIAQ